MQSTLSSSDKWQPLETTGSNPSFQETSQTWTSRNVHPERLEWIHESHASLRACRSQHAEFAPQRKDSGGDFEREAPETGLNCCACTNFSISLV